MRLNLDLGRNWAGSKEMRFFFSNLLLLPSLVNYLVSSDVGRSIMVAKKKTHNNNKQLHGTIKVYYVLGSGAWDTSINRLKNNLLELMEGKKQ